MVKIKPFKGIRPPKELVEEVASRPYDVLNSEEARKEAEGNEKSLYHIITSLSLKSIFPKVQTNMTRVCMKRRRRTSGCFRKKVGWCRMRSLAITFMPKQ